MTGRLTNRSSLELAFKHSQTPAHKADVMTELINMKVSDDKFNSGVSFFTQALWNSCHWFKSHLMIGCLFVLNVRFFIGTIPLDHGPASCCHITQAFTILMF